MDGKDRILNIVFLAVLIGHNFPEIQKWSNFTIAICAGISLYWDLKRWTS